MAYYSDGNVQSIALMYKQNALTQGLNALLENKVRPFEDPHTFATHNYLLAEHPYGVLNTKPRPLCGYSLLDTAYDIS